MTTEQRAEISEKIREWRQKKLDKWKERNGIGDKQSALYTDAIIGELLFDIDTNDARWGSTLIL